MIQCDLPYPSLWKGSRASPVRSPSALSRRSLDPLLSGSLFSSSCLKWFIYCCCRRCIIDLPASLCGYLLPRLSWAELACTGCSTLKPFFVTPLAGLLEWPLFVFISYVAWLCFTTSWKRTFERTLRGIWGGCVRSLHLFHQVLGWLSCSRSPTTRHAVASLVVVSPDLRSWLSL